jgi:hypothetical protein
MAQLEEWIEQNKASCRFPHKYTCDLIRMRNDIPSRSEASRFITDNGLDPIALANEYVLVVSLRTLSGKIEDGK